MRLLRVFLLVCLTTPAMVQADDWVDGYTRRDGTYVQGHYRTESDSNIYNNYSTRGNTNPYTGERGSVNPVQPYSQPRVYGSGQYGR